MDSTRICCFIFFSMLIQGSSEAWSKPLTIDTQKPIVIPVGLYQYTATGESNVFYARAGKSDQVVDLGTKTLFANYTLGNFNKLHQSSEPTLYGPLIGDDKGENLFLSWATSRTQEGKECNRDDRSKCSDIFFSESKNGGISWTTPIRVGREDMNDPVNRDFPRLLYVKETGRIYIFYSRFDDEKHSYVIGYVTKPAGSIILTKERLLPFEHEKVFHVAYTIRNAETVIHLVFKNSNNDYMHTQSIDIMNWKAPAKICQGSAGNAGFANGLVSNTQISKSNLFFGFTKEFVGFFVFSTDNGDTWSTPIKLSETGHLMISLAYCGTEALQKLFIVTLQQAPGFMLSIYDVNEKELSKGESPLGDDSVSYPLISCTKKASNNEVSLVVTGSTIDTFVGYITTTDYKLKRNVKEY